MKVVRIPEAGAALAHPETLRERIALVLRRGWRRNRGVLSAWSWWMHRRPSR